MHKKPTKCSKWWATTTATAARREIISNIYVSLFFILIRRFSQSEPRAIRSEFFPRDRSHSCTRLYLFAIPVAASAVARSLFHCTAGARATNKTLFNNWAIFQIVHCGILWSDRCFWCEAMRNFQCGKVNDDCNRNGIARLGLRTSVLGVSRVCVCVCELISVNACRLSITEHKWNARRGWRSDFRRHSMIGASQNVNVNYIERLKKNKQEEKISRLIGLIIYRSSDK